jgi:hypothetical protein
LVLVPPVASTVSRPSVTGTVTVAERNSAPAVDTKPAIAVTPSTRTVCVLSYAGWSPTDTVTWYEPSASAYSQAPGVVTPLVPPTSPYCRWMTVLSRAAIPARVRSRVLRLRSSGSRVPATTQPRPRAVS